MAFKDKTNYKISYSCNDLIKELKKDINEFGEGLKLYVITENLCGAKIYKDYNFYNGKNIGFKPREKEKVETITAGKLLKLYQRQNTVLWYNTDFVQYLYYKNREITKI